MKHCNKYKILTFLLCAVIAGGCSEYVYDGGGSYKPSLESIYLRLSHRDFNFSSRAERQAASLSCNQAWAFHDVPAWLTVSPESGNSNTEFTLTSSENTILSSRTAVFSVSTSINGIEIKRTLTASQEAAEPLFEFSGLSSTSLYLTGEAQTTNINVSTNIDDLELSIIGEKTDWVKARYADKVLTINVEDNRDDINRSATVRLWSAKYSKGGSIYLTQNRPNISFNEITQLNFDADGGSRNVPVTSELSWTAKVDGTWLSVSPAAGNAGQTEVTITALPSEQNDERTARVEFCFIESTSTEHYITVNQTGRYVEVATSTVELTTEGAASSSIEVDANVDWTVSQKPDWVILDPGQGKAGKTSVTVSASKNNSLNARSGNIVITDVTTGSIERTVSVSQEGLEIGDSEALEFSWRASSLPLTIPTPQSWSTAASTAWISLSQTSGTGETTIDVSVTRNDAEEARSGKVDISSEGQTVEAPVIQAGQYLHLTNPSGLFDPIGGSVELSLSSSINTQWSVDYAGGVHGWIGVDDSKENVFTIAVDPNPSIKDRSANFVVLPSETDVADAYGQGVKFAISQIGRKLSCDVSAINMTTKGGTSQTYNVTCDGAFEIRKEPEDSWYELVADTDIKSFHVVVSENTTHAVKTGKITISLTDLPDGESLTREVTVTQQGVEYTDLEKLEYDWHSATKELFNPMLGSWTATTSDNWISLSQSSGSGEAAIEVFVTRNDEETTRTGTINITSEGKTITAAVSQTGQYLYLDKTAVQVGPGEEVVSFSATTSMNIEYTEQLFYDQSEEYSWAAVERNADCKFRVFICENPSIKDRGGDIIVKPSDLDAADKYKEGVKLHIEQTGRKLSCNVDNISVYKEGGNTNIYAITCDGSYEITKNEEDTWYTIVNDASANKFYLNVAENAGKEPRRGKITISLINLPEGESLSHTINIYQEAPGFNLSFDKFEDDEIW